MALPSPGWCCRLPPRARSAAGEEGEDAADQLLVVGHIVRENPHLFHLGDIEGLAGGARRPSREMEGLEAGPARLGLVAHEHEVQLRPLPPRHLEEGPLAALALHGEELTDVRVV